MLYFYAKALHLIGIISWFAGLFYIVRLFIYHTEAQTRDESARKILHEQFDVMIRRLWFGITVPAMIVTTVFGSILAFLNPGLFKLGFMHIKMLFLVFLFIYHHKCGRIRKDLLKRDFKMSASRLRGFNEIATIIMFAVIFAIVLKDTIHWLMAMGGFTIFSILLFVVFKKRLQGKKAEDPDT